MPGAGTGVASAMVTLAALPCDAPAPTPSASRTVTSCPSRTSSYALPRPMMPPPTTTIRTAAPFLSVEDSDSVENLDARRPQQPGELGPGVVRQQGERLAHRARRVAGEL